MEIKYDVEIDNWVILNNIKKIINQIYRLLPSREEHSDWESPLNTIIVELCGMRSLLQIKEETFFILLCKLEGLYSLKEEADFFSYRRTIFECLSLCNSLKEAFDE